MLYFFANKNIISYIYTMCEVCNNSQARTATHARSKHHLKLLFAIMKEKLKTNHYHRSSPD
jgi:hypothetical protein